jgi:hypothetical protein
MGMDLTNVAGETYRFNTTSWRKVLELACQYGWKPQGTEPGRWYDETGRLCEQLSPNPDEWNGSYFSNDFQWVTDKEAANIAHALEQALDDIPDVDTGEKWMEYGPGDLPTSPVELVTVIDVHDPKAASSRS